jgi:hypothetical protein
MSAPAKVQAMEALIDAHARGVCPMKCVWLG